MKKEMPVMSPDFTKQITLPLDLSQECENIFDYRDREFYLLDPAWQVPPHTVMDGSPDVTQYT